MLIFKFKSVGGAFHKHSQQHFVHGDVSILFSKKLKTTGCACGVALTAKPFISSQANGPLNADMPKPICGCIQVWSLSWRK